MTNYIPPSPLVSRVATEYNEDSWTEDKHAELWLGDYRVWRSSEKIRHCHSALEYQIEADEMCAEKLREVFA